MVVDWERLAKLSGKFFLLILEYCIKLSAAVVTAVALAAKGTFGMKLGTGFGSISPALRNFFEAPAEIIKAANVIHEYNTMTADAFNERYGAEAINGVLSYLDGGIIYVQAVYGNFANQPFVTFFASVIAFGSLYLISLIIRFARQKGQGSYFNRLERKLGNRVFETNQKTKQTIPKQENKVETKPEPVKEVTKPFGSKSPKVNRHLQDYLKSAQSG